MIERIEEIIEEQNLREKTRYRYLVHRRWFLFDILRKHGIKFQRIAEMFDLNHSTIIYGISMADFFEKQQDELYLLDTLELQKEFAGKEIIFVQRNLVEDVLKCDSMGDLSLVQCRLKNNQYKNY
jgi:hypothetical protein